ncbi:hypothetical protein BEL07_08310 [Mycolicibacterium grossiae]|uniref:Uncharacterized protein n=1 Tax=Mycolicibacterium grossiae TaxID=1552759 RepID=A0A1E8Q6N8_9MYCO|nr:hypothetical protein BEL07_08310 [Mycolicibacterium grossiae]
MSGAEVDAEAFPVGTDVETVDDVRDGSLDGLLCPVVALQGALRDVRRDESATGELDGIELRFVAVELTQVRSISWADVAKNAWREALNRWCLSVMGSMMGCVVADGGFGVGRRDGWL